MWDEAIKTIVTVLIIPAGLALLKMQRDLIYDIIPKGFKDHREELEAQGKKADQRHEQHIREQEKMLRVLIAMKSSASRKGRGKKPPRGKPTDIKPA